MRRGRTLGGLILLPCTVEAVLRPAREMTNALEGLQVGWTQMSAESASEGKPRETAQTEMQRGNKNEIKTGLGVGWGENKLEL